MLGISKKQLSSKFPLQVENMPPSQKTPNPMSLIAANNNRKTKKTMCGAV
jgi:hypothetical protein